MKKIYRFIPTLAMTMPMIALAAGENVVGLITGLQNIVNAAAPVLMGLALVVFLWGIVKYITAGGNAEAEKTARGYIIYGIIGVFVMVAFWGIITFIGNALNIQPGASTTLPSFIVR